MVQSMGLILESLGQGGADSAALAPPIMPACLGTGNVVICNDGYEHEGDGMEASQQMRGCGSLGGLCAQARQVMCGWV